MDIRINGKSITLYIDSVIKTYPQLNHIESKKVKMKEIVEWWLPGLERGGNGKILVKRHKLPVTR